MTSSTGSDGVSAHSVTAVVTTVPFAVRRRMQEVSSAAMSRACSSSTSMSPTSSQPVLPSSRTAVAIMCAKGLVRAPSTTGTPCSSRRPAQSDRV
ncbi:hypothetical protein [Actinacidiphila bryophytorum]|uniref:hypothetical protein n=1 Tax=Actinacidiphila bryophytorum TaxID=1436133 RepID=UPI00195F9201|nr:hypothetical protein [Actinacidiphila bryophytorum]MBM9437977.1 hypothetical protein [Actinacidiphila bryophytorum]MBN6542669.1 hypothetical protein [Actinacidiphila bryophytorum]